MQRAKILFIGAGVLLATGVAFAQDPPAGGGGGDATAAGAGSGSGSAAGSVTAVPAGPTADWPIAINDRPLVLNQGKLDIHGGFPIATSSSTNAMGMSTSNTVEDLAIGATYGVADKIEIGGDYALRLNPDASAKGLLDFHGGYAALHSGKMDLAVAAGLQILFVDGVDATGMATTNSYLSLQLGAWLRYKVADKISIFTGNPGTPGGLPGFFGFVFPPVGYQLAIGLNNSGPTILSLPVGAGFQATPNIYAFLATDIADIYLSNGPANSSAHIFGSDFIPVGVGAFYSMPKLDVGVSISDDLKNAGDLYILNLLARFYVK